MPTPKPERKKVKAALTFGRKHDKMMGAHDVEIKSKNKSQKKELKNMSKKGKL